MRRRELFELHDHPRFPARLRNLVTDALQALWRFGNSYGAILPELGASLRASGDGAALVEVLDLCSGGGGPWPRLVGDLEREYGMIVHVRLTDRYPHPEAAPAPQGEGVRSRLEYLLQPLDAASVPAEMPGVRTLFSSLHHLGPRQVRRMLCNAVEGEHGIAVFEMAERSPMTLAILCLTPLLVLVLTPAMRPFRWSRLAFTYLLPVIPFVIGFDGLISCLRAYSTDELRELVDSLASPGYRWQVGVERRGLLAATFLIGAPVAEQ